MRFRFARGLAAVVAVVATQVAFAQYPARPIRIVVPFTAGSATDTRVRTLGEPLAKALGQPIVVDNRPGNNTAIGTEAVAKSTPDGYNLLAATNAGMAANPAGLVRSIGYDPVKDFTPVTRMAQISYVLVVQSTRPWTTLRELLDHLRADPGRLNYGSGNTGGILHMELMKRVAGVELTHVPYKSTPPALTDLLGGRIEMIFTDMATGTPRVRSGQLRGLVVTSPRRSPLLPDVPTFTEAGLGGMIELPGWWGLYGPAGMPRDITERLSREVNAALARPEIRERLLANGIEPSGTGPDELGAYTVEQVAAYRRLLKEFNIQPEQ
jgi:tripartite-type tricarboxylate transporter receptor subunit TctC